MKRKKLNNVSISEAAPELFDNKRCSGPHSETYQVVLRKIVGTKISQWLQILLTRKLPDDYQFFNLKTSKYKEGRIT